jgi:phosphohistidine swiveling domain-containing protein
MEKTTLTHVAYTLPLADPRAILEVAGGKGASLARLSVAGLPVPGGFHITTEAYRQFVANNNLQPAILAELEKVDASNPSTLEAASEAIVQRFLQGKMPSMTTEAITQAYASLSGADPVVAVRSSATAEDLPGLSFAGQQETYLNIRGTEAVLTAVQRCWSSLWTARAIGYRMQHNIDQNAVSLAVVVQQLVFAEASGILFTANPLSGRRDQAMISAAWGLGEAIVGGSVTPDTLVVDKATGHVLTRETVDKQVMTVRVEGGTEERPVPEAKRQAPVLDDQAAAELVRMGVQIEQLYALPMDIEWALAGGKFAIVQARPITALPEVQVEPPMEWKLPDPKGMYMRGSIIEQLPEPLTPLFSTLGGQIIDTATHRLFARLTGTREMKIKLFETINGYGYMMVNFGTWNTVRVAVAQVVKMNSIFKNSESSWRQAHDHYVEVIRRWQAKPPEGYTAVELLDGVRALTGETMQMYTVLQIGPIATALGSETMFTQVYNRLIKKKGDPDASVFVMGFESMPIRAELALYDLAEWARSCDGLAAHLTATPAAQLAAELESAKPPADLNPEEWDEWQRRFREHLAKYGHFTYDLDFSKAVAADDPAPLLETCRMYLLGKAGSPYARVQAIAGRREQATQAMLKRLHGPKRWIFRKQVHSAQKYAPLREDGLSDLGLGYPLLRKMLHELGRRLVRSGALEQPEDVFWLNEQEVDQAADALDQGRPLSSMKAAVQDRRAIWKAEQRVSPPVVLPVGSKYMGMDVEKLTSGGPTEDLHVIKGFGSSQGKVTAPARVLLGPEDFNQMRPGDVLVAPLTTPAWTPLFAMASAIVTDIGGPLSHSSIVAREYGIPAVLGTGVATRRIRSGQIITVDGSVGTVLIADRDAS